MPVIHISVAHNNKKGIHRSFNLSYIASMYDTNNISGELGLR